MHKGVWVGQERKAKYICHLLDTERLSQCLLNTSIMSTYRATVKFISKKRQI